MKEYPRPNYANLEKISNEISREKVREDNIQTWRYKITTLISVIGIVITFVGTYFPMQGKNERLKSKFDSTQLLNSRLTLNRDSLKTVIEYYEAIRILKEAKVLMSKWNWSEAEIKLISIIRDHPNSAEADEAVQLIEIIKAELLKLDTKPISYEDVLREDLEKFRKIERELIGKKYIAPFSLGVIEKYGFPETQVGTSNDIWVAYFPTGRFTIYMNKKNDEIVKVINDQLKKW